MGYIYGKNLIKIALVDDHALIRDAVCRLIDSWESCKVIIKAQSGPQLIETIDPENLPELIIVDLKIPGINGFETIAYLKKNYPSLRFLCLSIYQGEEIMIRLLKAGAQGFLHKSEESSVLKKAIYEMMRSGYYFSDQAASKLVKQLINNQNFTFKTALSDEEINFLKYIITEKTYHEIAVAMDISVRHVEYLRKTLFEYFDAKSRTGLAVQAIDKGLTI